MIRVGILAILLIIGLVVWANFNTAPTVSIEKPLANKAQLPVARMIQEPPKIAVKSKDQPDPQVATGSVDKVILDGKETASLETSVRLENEWSEQRTKFLEVDCRLSDAKLAKLDELRTKVISEESALMKSGTSSEEAETELREQLSLLRQDYLDNLKTIVGSENFKSLKVRYKYFWKIESTKSPHQVLL